MFLANQKVLLRLNVDSILSFAEILFFTWIAQQLKDDDAFQSQLKKKCSRWLMIKTPTLALIELF